MLILYWFAKGSKALRSVNFDVVTTESHEALSTITKHPVEEGTDVSDNATPEGERLTVEGYVSNKPLLSNLYANPLASAAETNLLTKQTIPLKYPSTKQTTAPIFTPGGLTSAVTGAISGLLHPEPKAYSAFKAADDFPDRAKKVYDLLREAKQEAALIRAITKLGTVENLMIERIAVPRTTEDGNGASFQLDLQQVRIVKSETVDAPVPTELRGAIAESKGSKATASKNDDKLKKTLKSAMASGYDAADGAVGAVGKLITGGI